MARKSRKQIQVVEHFPTEFPIIVGYARLSVNDRVESHSIENQKKIIALWPSSTTPDFKVLCGYRI